MALTRAGMKRKAVEDLQDQNLSKSPRLKAPGRRNQSRDSQPPEIEGNNVSNRIDRPDGDGREQHTKDRETADEFINRLILLFELRRMDTEEPETSTTKFFDQAWAQPRRVCDMFGTEDLPVNPEIEVPWNAMAALRNLSASIGRAQEHQKEYENVMGQWEEAVAAKTKATIAHQRRQKATPQEAVDIAVVVAAEQKAADEARTGCEHSRSQLLFMKRAAEEEASFPLSVVESYLVKKDLLLPRPPPPPEQDERQTQQTPATAEVTEQDHRGVRASPTQTEQDPPSPRSMAEVVQEEKREALRKAEQAVWDAEHSREAARRNYKRDIREYFEANRDGKVIGTKEVFDRDFLLTQMEYTRKQKYAEEELERMKETAMIVGAIDPGDAASEISDSDDPFDGASNCGEDLMWQARQDEIKR